MSTLYLPASGIEHPASHSLVGLRRSFAIIKEVFFMGKKSKKKRKLKKKKILSKAYKSEVIEEIQSEFHYKQDKNKILLKTMTQELYMLARIHYDLFDKEKIQLIFSKLRCMQYDNQGRWVWLYEAEAKKLKFTGSYDKIPKERRPIILGSFYSKNVDKMYIDVNSFDRAKKAVVFFDKCIPRAVARVTDIEILNKAFDSYDANLPKHKDYFDEESIEIKDPERTINELTNITSSIKNPLEKLEVALTHMENDSKQPISEVERFPIHFYEDGMTGLEGCLTVRETIALQHWKGNKDYTFHDLMQQIIPKMPPIKLK